MLAYQFIQRCIQAARHKCFTGLYLLPPFPPARIPVIKNALYRAWFAGLFALFPLFLSYRLFF